MAARREFDMGGSSVGAPPLDDGRRSRETPTESSKARYWRRGEHDGGLENLPPVRARQHASRRAEDGRVSKAEIK